MVQMMLNIETLLIRVQDDEGLTPLHCAAAEVNRFQLLKILVKCDNEERESSALYIQDNKGRTPLHIAVIWRNWKAIDKFTKSRPDCIEIVDNHGQNVIHYAAKWGCLSKLEGVLEEQEQLYNLLNEKDMDGNTLLHLFTASIPNLGHACLQVLPFFLRSNSQYLDIKAFNKQNLTIGDIFASKFQMKMIHPDPPFIQRVRSWMAPRGKRIITYERDIDVVKANSNAETKLASLRKAAQGQSLVAALIAAVSFAAGFTLPGGLNQNPGDHKNIGMSILTSKAGFKIFLISDAIAFTCSSIAILSYFITVTTVSNLVYESLSYYAIFLNTIALGALMLAFAAGVSVVVSQSPTLIFALWAIFLVFFFNYVKLIVRNLRAGLQLFTRCSARNHHIYQ